MSTKAACNHLLNSLTFKCNISYKLHWEDYVLFSLSYDMLTLSRAHTHHKPRKRYTDNNRFLDPQDKKSILSWIHHGCSFSNVETVLSLTGFSLLLSVPREIPHCLGSSGMCCNSISWNESMATESTMPHSSTLWNIVGFPKMLTDFNTIIGALQRCILCRSMTMQFARWEIEMGNR